MGGVPCDRTILLHIVRSKYNMKVFVKAPTLLYGIIITSLVMQGFHLESMINQYGTSKLFYV